MLGRFFTEYFIRVYKAFDGDLTAREAVVGMVRVPADLNVEPKQQFDPDYMRDHTQDRPPT